GPETPFVSLHSTYPVEDGSLVASLDPIPGVGDKRVAGRARKRIILRNAGNRASVGISAVVVFLKRIATGSNAEGMWGARLRGRTYRRPDHDASRCLADHDPRVIN